ncbi:hypothetical protein BJ138DRAFT_1120100 [Hygrophoropsis aurantiaca]|uniref:Uncharacterized protein n=1 Tax=Hygrophoropsis aurantiaca TaxID=72124 RepID=A0ACB7ZRD2_9AGAM|nr:hypothetical protein BJ138DRAFT_1120100 [Hygrophoropsis aurantiaca]
MQSVFSVSENANEHPRRSRPSENWLKSPSWIDGGVDPPRFYSSQEEMNIDRVAVGYPPLRGSVPERSMLTSQPVSSGSNGTIAEPSATQAACVATSIPCEATGHLVSITTVYTAFEKPISARSSRAPVKKSKARTTKSDQIILDGTTRAKFIEAALAVHDIADQYSPGVYSGPSFKFWWTGSSGGKTGATMIENDHDFEVAVAAILKKKKDTCHVNVEFDLDDMDGYRITTRKRGLPRADNDNHGDSDELLYGTKVPRLDGFTEEQQLHGSIILDLKAKYSCERHQGEHGEAGYCFVDASGEHLGLNPRKLKIWAAAIAAADATKHHPPNNIEFDGIRDGRLTVKPRGRSGPVVPPAPQASDATALMMAALVPLIVNNLTARQSHSSDSAEVVPGQPTTPTRPRQRAQPPLSPAPAVGFELHACITDFLKSKEIDLTESEPVLTQLELTPDILPEVPVTHLCELMNTVEGRVRKFQVFCKEWSARLEAKRQQ